VFNKEPMVQLYNTEADVQNHITLNNVWSNDLYPFLYTNAGVVDTNDRKFTMVEEGHCPHAAIAIPFGILDDPSTWFNAPAYGDIDLVLTQDTASSAVSVCVEQIRPN